MLVTVKGDERPQALLWACDLAQPFWKATRQYLAKLNLGTPCDPETPLLGNHLRETPIKIPERAWAGMLIAVLLVTKVNRTMPGERQQETTNKYVQQQGQVDLKARTE